MAYTKEKFYQEFQYNRLKAYLYIEYLFMDRDIKFFYYVLDKKLVVKNKMDNNPLEPYQKEFENIEFKDVYDTLLNWDSPNNYLKQIQWLKK